MIRLSSLRLAALLGSASACTGSTPVPADLALTHVSVVDVLSGRVRVDQTVLVAGNRITAIGPTVRVQIHAGARVVEADGKYVIPGLWDMHVHSSSDWITRATILPLHVAHGVTGVRDMKADCFEPCDAVESSFEQVQQWRADIAAGRLVGPRIVAASTMIQGPPPGEPSSIQSPATKGEARDIVRLLKERGVDLIKIYNRLPREAFFALADEARRQGITFAGHVPNAVRASEASDAGQRSIEHLTGIIECSRREEELRPLFLTALRTRAPTPGTYVIGMLEDFSEEKCKQIYSRFVENATWQVPTLGVHVEQERSASRDWRDDPRLKYVTSEERAFWAEQLHEHNAFWPGGISALALLNRRKREVVARMQRAGVGLLAGSDAGAPLAFPGFTLHDELELLVGAGLKAADALQAATLNPARYLNATDSLGTVQAGKVADLVLLDANPIDDIRNTRRISAVVLNGRYLDRSALDRLLAQVEAAANR